VGSYSFEEGGGIAVTDGSGHDNHGVLINPRADTWAIGHTGGGLSLPGIGGYEATFVDLGNPADFQLSTAFTFAAWVFNTAPNNDAPILAKEDATYGPSYWFGVYFNGFGTLADVDGAWWWDLDRRGVPVPAWGGWNHLASTWDGTTLKQYLNGALVDSAPFSGPIANLPSHLTIGASVAGGTALTGRLDDVEVYNYALSEADVFDLAATCETGWVDCDGNPANRCETNLQADAANCGACGNVCAPHTACSAGVCAGACAPGFGDCDGIPANGCEADVWADAGNCGACGNVCAAEAACSAGACLCPPPLLECAGACVDRATAPSHCGTVPTSGLVAWYRFQGGAADESGNGFHGVTQGGVEPATDRLGRPGGALGFDGSSGFVTVDQWPGLLDFGQPGYTIAGWFSSTDVSKPLQMVLSTHPHFGLGATLNHVGAPGRMLWLVGPGWTWDFVEGGAKSDFASGEWYSFALVKSGATWSFYVDGVLDQSATLPQSDAYSGASGLWVGAIEPGLSDDLHFFQGALDDYRVYARALSLAEVRALHREGGFQKPCPAPRTSCDGACLDTQSDPANCGACGNVCGSMTVCAAGTCAPVTPLVDLRADMGVETSPAGTVTRWIDQSGNGFDATPAVGVVDGPAATTATVNGRSHPVLRFGGSQALEAASSLPAQGGTVFIVLGNMTRPFGPEYTLAFNWGMGDACDGRHGVGLVPDFFDVNEPGALNYITRNEYAVGDIGGRPIVSDMEVITLSWGANGETLERRRANGEVLTAARPSAQFPEPALTAVSDGGHRLSIGSEPISCGVPRFKGDLAAFLAYPSQLREADRIAIATALHAAWVAGP
jgi:hypothetical protein